MQSSIVIRNSSTVNQWWFMDSTATKTLSQLFLIHRSCFVLNNKTRRNNINCQNLKTVLNSNQWLSSVLSGVSTNKAINVDCQATPFFLPVRCAASYRKRYTHKKQK